MISMIYNVSEYGSKFCVDKNTLLRMLERAFEEGYFGDKESKIARIKAIMDQLPSAKVPKVIS